jgi:SAM-dependent methyltransferase
MGSNTEGAERNRTPEPTGSKMSREEALAVLRSNVGFGNPAEWVDYAIAHSFKRVQARSLNQCPDCQSAARNVVGQFVYYSCLGHLWQCRCGLVYSDVRLPTEIIANHFDLGYKDEDYFVRGRRRVFSQMARIIAKRTPQGGGVLDIGGANGHFLMSLGYRRPDLRLLLNDLSPVACDAAASAGIESVPGGVDALEEIAQGRQFDAVVASDVIYYEPEIRRFFEVLRSLLKPGGTVLFRIPNRFTLIRLANRVAEFRRRMTPGLLGDSLQFFNPEHLYILTIPFIRQRLAEIGFESVRCLPSPLYRPHGLGFLADVTYGLSWTIARLTGGMFCPTPSILIVARFQ